MTNFPTSLDTFLNPGSTTPQNAVGYEHDVQHAKLNDAVHALEAKVGIDGSAVATSFDFRIAALEAGGGGGGGAVGTVFGRTGTVVATTGDYTAAQVTNALDMSATRAAHLVLAGPTTGSASAPAFRSLVAGDIPSLSATYLALTGGTLTGALTLAAGGANFGSSVMFQDSANVLAIRNGTNPQRLDIYKSFTDASNYRRGSFYWGSGNDFFVSTNAAGTGTSSGNLVLEAGGMHSIRFRINSVDLWNLNDAGMLGPISDNAYDIGGVGNQIRTIYAGTLNTTATNANSLAAANVVTGSGSSSVANLSTVWNTTGNPTLLSIQATVTACGATSRLLDMVVGSGSVFSVDTNGSVATLGDITVGGITTLNAGVVIPTGATAGYVLTTDDFGNATWQAATGGSGGDNRAGNYSGGAPSYTPATSPAFAIDSSNGAFWLYYAAAWHNTGLSA